MFVSSQAVDREPAAQLIASLRALGVAVEHSPSNPAHKRDLRWGDWYDHGLPATLRLFGIFVIVVDAGWDSSTWMAQEADLALVSRRMDKQLGGYFWNPDRHYVTAAGMVRYLKEELPAPVQVAAGLLAGEAGGRTTG